MGGARALVWEVKGEAWGRRFVVGAGDEPLAPGLPSPSLDP